MSNPHPTTSEVDSSAAGKLRIIRRFGIVWLYETMLVVDSGICGWYGINPSSLSAGDGAVIGRRGLNTCRFIDIIWSDPIPIRTCFEVKPCAVTVDDKVLIDDGAMKDLRITAGVEP